MTITSAYVKQCVKLSVKQAMVKSAWPSSKVIATELRRMYESPVARKGLFGNKVKALANKYGVTFGVHKAPSYKSFVEQLLENTKMLPNAVRTDTLNKAMRDAKVLFAPTATAEDLERQIFRGKKINRRNVAKPLSHELGEDKWKEYLTFKNYMPRTYKVSTLMKAVNDPVLVEKILDKKFGSGQWIMKQRMFGFGADPSKLMTKGKLTPKLMGRYRPEDLIAQRRNDISVERPYAIMDNMLPASVKKNYGAMLRGTNEYRVHVLNGQVVPYATIHRGSLSKGRLQAMLPFRTPDVKSVEDFASRAAANMPGKHQKGFFGFDIGINNKTGKPFLIEANPATQQIGSRGGMSGFIENPFTRDAINSAMQGRVPLYVKARTGLYGMGAAGALGAGAYGMSGDSDENPPQAQA